jgi:hypothetical protein
MAAVRRIGLFRREIRESLDPAAVEVLLASATRISEGQVGPDGRFYGSTMLTIDLERIRPQVKDACDVATAARLAALLEAAAALHERLGRLAVSEARRIAGSGLRRPEADLRVRTEGTRVFIDIDVEAETQVAPAAGGRR